MSIRCVCPNGHLLKVKESLAGTSGLCPTCRARVNVPSLRAQRMSEDVILDILGRDMPAAQGDTLRSLDPVGDTRLDNSQEQTTHWRQCYKCQREYPTTVHICPFCHTYIATLSDF